MSLYTQAVKRWEDDVDKEAARRVERGIPPYMARKQAEDYISGIRRAKARDKDRLTNELEQT